MEERGPLYNGRQVLEMWRNTIGDQRADCLIGTTGKPEEVLRMADGSYVYRFGNDWIFEDELREVPAKPV